MRSLTRKKSAVIVLVSLLVGAVGYFGYVVNAPVAMAAGCTIAAPFGTHRWCGYFHGNFDDNGDDVFYKREA